MGRERKPKFSGRRIDVQLGDYPTEPLTIIIDANHDDSKEQEDRAHEALEWIRSMPAYVGSLREDAEALERDLVALQETVKRAVSRLAEVERKARDEAAETVQEWPSTHWQMEDLSWPDDEDLDALDRIYAAVHALAAPKKCRHCGKEFVAVEGGRERKYCSLNCRVGAYRARQKVQADGAPAKAHPLDPKGG